MQFKFSMLATSVALCFAAHANAADLQYVGNVTIDGKAHPIAEVNGFTITTEKDVVINGTGKYESDGKQKGNHGIWYNHKEKGASIKGNNLTVSSEFGRGIQVTDGGKLTVDVANDMTVNATKGDIGIFVLAQDSAMSIKTKTLTVNTGAEGLFGIHVQNNTQTATAPQGAASLKIEADKITVNGGELGLTAYSNGQMNISGDLTVNAKRAIEMRGYSTMNINTDGKHSTVLNGDIVFGTPATKENAHNSGNLVDAYLNLNLVGKDSSWTGRAFKELGKDAQPTIDPNNSEYYGDVSNFNLQLSNNASWNMTGDSFVNTLGVKDGGNVVVQKDVQKVIANNVELSGGSFDIQGNAAANVDSLTGTGGAVALAATLNKDESINPGTLAVKNPVASEAKLDVAVYGITADDITNSEKAMASLNEKVTVADNSKVSKVNKIEEGDVKGAITQTVDANGKTGAIQEAVNQKLDGYSSIAALSAVQWRHENDTLFKRMGELRDLDGAVGAWARLYGSEQEYGAQSVKAQNTTIQVGADYDIGSGWKVGGAFSYTDGSSTFDMGDSNSDMYGLAVYGTWLADNGQFVDVIAKYSRLSNEFTSGTMKGDFDNNAVSLGAEAGWHFKLSDLGFVEPSAGLTYGRIMGDNFVAHNGVRVEQEDYDSLIARLSVRSGFYFPNQKGNIYARAAVLHDFMGDMEATASKANAAGALQTSHFKEELGDTWVEYGIGANFDLSKTAYTFVDLEKTAGGDVKESWKWTVGARLTF